ncbi:tyrosine-protein phosphatase [Singulisphaera sp. PoT]|uniref:tyrosine-protein phosphatase n=1 Tax=Singulisphaera sp. PoT TaxID=3411797 RepID=UPI003BF5CFEB
MSSSLLGKTVRQHRIKTVLNLRGANPKDSWYRAERSATLKAGATQVDVHMASDLWLARDEAKTLLEVLDTCEYPLMVHCQWGAERTGLVTAMIELLRPGGTLESARRQFSAYYMYLPMGDGIVMAQHLESYARWLKGEGEPHTPARFREWLTSGYKPGHPSREEWPYNPYPLLIVSKATQPEQTTQRPVEKGTARQ